MGGIPLFQAPPVSDWHFSFGCTQPPNRAGFDPVWAQHPFDGIFSIPHFDIAKRSFSAQCGYKIRFKKNSIRNSCLATHKWQHFWRSDDTGKQFSDMGCFGFLRRSQDQSQIFSVLSIRCRYFKPAAQPRREP